MSNTDLDLQKFYEQREQWRADHNKQHEQWMADHEQRWQQWDTDRDDKWHKYSEEMSERRKRWLFNAVIAVAGIVVAGVGAIAGLLKIL